MIVYFDGHCNLCNGFVDFLIRRDPNGRLKFAPLQGATARAQLPPEYIAKLNSVVLQDDRGLGRASLATESLAALRTIAALGGIYSAAQIFVLVPRFLRDFVYRQVAKNRYRWFGRRDTCRIATPAERAHFLD